MKLKKVLETAAAGTTAIGGGAIAQFPKTIFKTMAKREFLSMFLKQYKKKRKKKTKESS